MDLKIGDVVKFLKESGQARVIKINPDSVTVLLDNGFEEDYRVSELLPVQPLEVDHVPPDVVSEPIETQSVKNHAPKETIIDLHFGQLVDYPSRYQPHKILPLQLKALLDAIQSAKSKGVTKLIVIHGKGSGKLESAVKSKLNELGLTYYDADFRRYKLGALEILL